MGSELYGLTNYHKMFNYGLGNELLPMRGSLFDTGGKSLHRALALLYLYLGTFMCIEGISMHTLYKYTIKKQPKLPILVRSFIALLLGHLRPGRALLSWP